MGSVTIKDIAKALNISTSTVSRALRDSYDINTETKKKIVAYAEKVNYRPNPIALSLKENKSRSIGVIVPEIANNFFSQAINGIEEIAFERGYHVVIFQSHESKERETSNVQHLFARKVDGLIISLSGSTTDVEHIESKNLPVVYFDRVPDLDNVHKVVVDNFEGAFKATEFLLQKGKTKIAHLTSISTLSITQERLQGYKSALEKYNITFDENLVKYCDFGPNDAEIAMAELIESQQPDAFFMASDRLTLDCLKAYKKLMPENKEELPLIGFTNLNIANLLSPSLYTVTQPAFKIGQKAIEILLDEIENKRKGKTTETVKLFTELNT